MCARITSNGFGFKTNSFKPQICSSAQVWPSAISGLTNQQAQGEQFLHNEVSTMRCRLGLLARTNCAWLAARLRIVRNLPLCPPPHLKPNEREANPAANTTEQESKSKQSLVSSSRSKKIGCVCVCVCTRQGQLRKVHQASGGVSLLAVTSATYLVHLDQRVGIAHPFWHEASDRECVCDFNSCMWQRKDSII